MIIKVYVKPADYPIIKEYAKSKHRSVSEFLLSTTMAEINRRTQTFDLKAAVCELVQQELKDHFPSMGKASGRDLKHESRNIMKIVCMDCHKILGEKPGGFEFNYSLCPECYNIRKLEAEKVDPGFPKKPDIRESADDGI